MALKNYVDQATIIDALWLNQVDVLKETIFAAATSKALARMALFSDDSSGLVNRATQVNGSANALVITTPVFSYSSDSVLMISSNQANNGAVTINPNGLGVRNLVMPDGTPLLGSELLPGYPAILVYSAGLSRFFLINPNPSLGTFIGTLTGLVGSVQVTISYLRQGKMVGLSIPATTGVSNSNTMTLLGTPASIAPRLNSGGFQTVGDFPLFNNGALNQSQFFFNGSVLSFGLYVVSGSVIVPTSTGFTSSGVKGLGFTEFNYWTA